MGYMIVPDVKPCFYKCISTTSGYESKPMLLADAEQHLYAGGFAKEVVEAAMAGLYKADFDKPSFKPYSADAFSQDVVLPGAFHVHGKIKAMEKEALSELMKQVATQAKLAKLVKFGKPPEKPKSEAEPSAMTTSYGLCELCDKPTIQVMKIALSVDGVTGAYFEQATHRVCTSCKSVLCQNFRVGA